MKKNQKLNKYSTNIQSIRIDLTWICCLRPHNTLSQPWWQLEDIVGCKILHFINNEDQEVLGYKTLWRKRRINFLQRE